MIPSILFEDEHVVVIDKPSGMLVHNTGITGEGSATVVDWFLSHAPQAHGVGEVGYAQTGAPLERSGVVHRLDRETSGVMILAKDQDTFFLLKQQFQHRHVRKEYRAIVYDTMKEKWGTVNRPIGRSAKNPRLRSAERGARGKLRDAVTDWELIGQSDAYAYLKVFPRTGRTHQIRVHLKSISRPIVADTLYASPHDLERNTLGFTRLALHAYNLTLAIPGDEKRTFCAPLPHEFEVATTSLAIG